MKRIKENNGTAIILMLVIVSVLFIFTSFLVRKVVINTTMVEKSGQEQESYAIAKQGILYALDKLNTWDGTSPDYDSTSWLNSANWCWLPYPGTTHLPYRYRRGCCPLGGPTTRFPDSLHRDY